MFLLLAGCVGLWARRLLTRREDRSAFADEVRASPLHAAVTLVGVAECLAFGLGLLFPAMGMVEPFGLGWPIWAIGGGLALAFFVLDIVLPDRR